MLLCNTHDFNHFLADVPNSYALKTPKNQIVFSRNTKWQHWPEINILMKTLERKIQLHKKNATIKNINVTSSPFSVNFRPANFY